MTERIIRFRQNRRFITRGVTYNPGSDRFEIDINEGETLDTTLNFAHLLTSGETISSVTSESDGITATTSVSSPNITLTLSNMSGYSTADITLTVTRSGGQVHKVRIRARQTRDYTTQRRYTSWSYA